ALDIPVRFDVEGPRVQFLEGRSQLGLEVRSHARRDFDRPRPIELALASGLTNRDRVDAEVDQVASPVGDVGPSVFDSLAPLVEAELAVRKLDVDPAETHPFAVDAGEVGLTADAGPVATIERVVPDRELPRGGGIDARDEINGVVHDVDDVLVRAD